MAAIIYVFKISSVFRDDDNEISGKLCSLKLTDYKITNEIGNFPGKKSSS